MLGLNGYADPGSWCGPVPTVPRAAGFRMSGLVGPLYAGARVEARVDGESPHLATPPVRSDAAVSTRDAFARHQNKLHRALGLPGAPLSGF